MHGNMDPLGMLRAASFAASLLELRPLTVRAVKWMDGTQLLPRSPLDDPPSNRATEQPNLSGAKQRCFLFLAPSPLAKSTLNMYCITYNVRMLATTMYIFLFP